MGHVALHVTDLEAVVRHAKEVLGLRVVEEADGWVYVTCGERHHDLMLRQGTEVVVDHVSFETWNEEAFDQLLREGVDVVSDEVEEAGIERSLRFRSPEGHVIEIYSGMEQVPAGYNGVGVRPRKYGHTTLKVLDCDAIASFLSGTLGLIVSDRVADAAIWMRCDSDHHGLAMIKGDQIGLHHHAWEVESWTHLEMLGDRLLENDRTFIFGPGRHGPGRNLFCYHLDPAGVCIEYFADLEQVHDDGNTGRDWPMTPESINVWGPAMPDDFQPLCTPQYEPAAAALAVTAQAKEDG
jgi:catechol-2,3-dioxygenase